VCGWGENAMTRIGLLAAACLVAVTSTAFAQSPSNLSTYAIEGFALGARIPSDGSAYREYKCGASDQFDGFTWCQKTRQERRNSSEATYSLLHSVDGKIVYINRYQAPISFARNEAERDVRSYSRKFGESPRTIRMPTRLGIDGILASWGKTVLEPLDEENRKAFAEGKRLSKGYYIDFIGNFDRSAKEGFPLYRIGGGAGFIYAASFDQRGRGTLRVAAVDASAFYPDLLANQVPSESRNVSSTATDKPSADADIAGQQVEKAAEAAKAELQVARQESETANRNAQLAKTEIEKLNAEAARLNNALQQLQTDKSAAEGKVRVMESVAYTGFIVAVIAILSSLFFVIRKKSTEPKWIGPETIPIPKGGDTHRSEVGDIHSSSLEPAQASISNADVVGSQRESGVSDTKSTPNPEMPPDQTQSEAKPQTESAAQVSPRTIH
jgi:hypothetical protein